ncbi:MAG: cytochrome c oxidase assembly protein [Myxococcaceae bacterium]
MNGTHHAAGVSLGWTLALSALLLLYTAGFRRLPKSEPAAVSGWRFLGFLLGLLSLWAALASPLSQLDHQRLLAHMLQHLWVMNVAAPLLLLAEPLRVAALAPGFLPRGTGWLRPVLRPLTHPAVCWLSGISVVLLFHLPAVLQLTLASPYWHAAEHASFLVAGLLFWWPVVLPWPGTARWPRFSLLLYLFLATLPCDALSAFLAFSGRVVYPHYLEGPHASGAVALADQQAAGALMWGFVTLAYLVAAVAIALEHLLPRSAAGRGVAAG